MPATQSRTAAEGRGALGRTRQRGSGLRGPCRTHDFLQLHGAVARERNCKMVSLTHTLWRAPPSHPFPRLRPHASLSGENVQVLLPQHTATTPYSLTASSRTLHIPSSEPAQPDAVSVPFTNLSPFPLPPSSRQPAFSSLCEDRTPSVGDVLRSPLPRPPRFYSTRTYQTAMEIGPWNPRRKHLTFWKAGGPTLKISFSPFHPHIGKGSS